MFNKIIKYVNNFVENEKFEIINFTFNKDCEFVCEVYFKDVDYNLLICFDDDKDKLSVYKQYEEEDLFEEYINL